MNERHRALVLFLAAIYSLFNRSNASARLVEFETLIVGGGVAGLSAALVLGRCRRRVLVCDDGRPRNAVAHGVHAYLGRDGVPPAEFLNIARAEAMAYPGVQWRHGTIVDVTRRDGGFMLEGHDGSSVTGATLLLATGLVDELPTVPGFRQFWGHSVFTCPFCDGWEVRDQRFVTIGRGADVYEFALELRQWASELLVCTDGPARLDVAARDHLARLKIPLLEQPVQALEGGGTQVSAVRFVDGTAIETRVVFLTTCQHQRTELAVKLGCRLDAAQEILTDRCGYAAEDVWVAGNASAGLQLSIIAAAEGAAAAHAINERLVARGLEGT
ncbi:MAG TPA: NAD(P)/FAD-dependent oxidoreductase [Candidatus Synoicihabitans sp.]|nr:NAD(P)/FAD-dependent oxidoreductase [Candidatus Synoicihabitans sp.]